jgi:hypothetical protein
MESLFHQIHLRFASVRSDWPDASSTVGANSFAKAVHPTQVHRLDDHSRMNSLLQGITDRAEGDGQDKKPPSTFNATPVV